MKLLTILLYAGAASASVVQFCTGFEGRTDKFTPLFEVSASTANTSVLIAHITDFKREFMNRFDLDVEERMPDGLYPICTEEPEKATMTNISTAELVGMLEVNNIVEEKLAFPINNTRLGPGEKLTYEIKSSGIYCALVYQPGTDGVRGVEFKASHSYGDYNLTSYQFVKCLLAIIGFLLVYLLISRCVFSKMSEHPKSGIWSITKSVLLGKLTIWGIHNFYKCFSLYDLPYLPLSNPWFIFDHILSFLLMVIIYSVILGASSVFVIDFLGSGKYDYLTEGDISCVLTTLAVQFGQVGVQSYKDSTVLNVVTTDISGACIAFFMSSEHGSHFESCTHDLYREHQYKDENATDDIEMNLSKSGERQEGEGETSISDFSESDLDQRDGDCNGGTCIILWFSLASLILYYIVESCGKGDPYRGNIYPGHALESRVSYHHVIGLNLCFNWMMERFSLR